MTLPSITAPIGTPVFLAEGHGIDEAPVFADVTPGTGHARRRRVWTVPTRTVSVRWLLDAADLQAVDQWYEDTLQAGALPWSAQVANDQGAGLVWWAARWVEFGIVLLHYGRGIVSGTLLLIGEPSTVAPETGVLSMELRARLLDMRSPVYLTNALAMELTAALLRPSSLGMEVMAALEQALGLLAESGENLLTEVDQLILLEQFGNSAGFDPVDPLDPPDLPAEPGAGDVRFGMLIFVVDYGSDGVAFASTTYTDTEVGGVSTITTTDDGATWNELGSDNVDDFVVVGYGVLTWTAALSDGVFLNIGLNYSPGSNYSAQRLGDLDLLTGVMPTVSANDQSIEDWKEFGYPRTTGSDGEVIWTRGLFSDGTYFYINGFLADVDSTKRLFRATGDAEFVEQGVMTQDPADPNMLGGSSYAAFANFWLPNRVDLKKIGTRWWMVSTLAAYYTDDADGLEDWRWADLGFSEDTRTNPPAIIRGPIKVGTDLVAFDSSVTLLGPRVSVSTDDGATWTPNSPAAFNMTDTVQYPVSFDGKAFVYIYRANTWYVARAVAPFTSWTVEVAYGLPVGLYIAQLFAGATRIFGVMVDGMLVSSADGITFTQSTIT